MMSVSAHGTRDQRTSARVAEAPRRGLASPAVWLVVLAAVALFIALSAAPARAVTQPFDLTREDPITLVVGVDDWQHIWEVVQYSQVQQTLPGQPAGPRVYYLGDSIARESTISDAAWTLQLNRRADAAGKVTGALAFTVAGHNQTLGMDEAIVEGVKGLPATPAGQPRGIVLIGVGISRFIGPPTPERPYPIDPPPAGQLPGFSPWTQHHYDDRALLSVTRKKELVPRWMDRRWAGFKSNRAANFAAVGRLITACKAKDLRPVLFDLPLDLAVVGKGLDKPRGSIAAGCATLARSRGVTYLRLQPSLNLPNTDFWDIHHLVKPGYKLWQSRLSAELVKLFPKATTL